tara:strand:+ start:111148 stop:111879 length:732 start_codon:yes stop_codon:yes gene_type:complete
MRIFKAFLRRTLERRGIHTTWAAEDQVAGLQLKRDLPLVVGTDAPLCIDIGGNKGQTVELFQSTFRDPTIHVFEPTSRLASLIQSRFQPPAVTVHQLAVGDAEGEADLQCYSADDMNSLLTLNTHSHELFEGVKATGTERVRVCRLDDYLAEVGLASVDLLKIDTQGFDGRVLRGAANLLNGGSVKAVMVEMNFVRMYDGQSDAGDIMKMLIEFGYRPVDLYEKVRASQRIAWCTALFTRIES